MLRTKLTPIELQFFAVNVEASRIFVELLKRELASVYDYGRNLDAPHCFRSQGASTGLVDLIEAIEGARQTVDRITSTAQRAKAARGVSAL